MKKILLPLLLLATCVSTGSIMARPPVEPDLKRLARIAVSEDAEISAPAIKALRAYGAPGLQALLDTHAETIQGNANRNFQTDPAAWKRLTAVLDGVGQQKDCHAAKLYWFTDFDQAQAASKETGKPILSLRLLGKLEEEFSCANSRFFRTTLYPNPEVSAYLRENFVLHWKSVRPVPRVTIDFGDGRKIERTVTGNSIHYVLASDGTPIDALPGLYSAKTFLAELSHARNAAKKFETFSGERRGDYLRNYHRERLTVVQQDYLKEVSKLNEEPVLLPIVNAAPGQQPDAKRAAAMAISKSGVERPLVGGMVVATALLQNPIERQMNDPIWSRIAALHAPEAKLDTNSFQLVRSKNPTATDASTLAITKSFNESPLLKVVANLERSIAEDTVRNRYVLHRQIHNWYSSGQAPADIEQLNRKVYAELFLTPDTDPWLGLVPKGTFSGLQNDGLVHAGN